MASAGNPTLKQIFQSYALYVNGTAFTGDVYEVDLPKLNWHVVEYRGGGMDVPVEVKLGHEKLEMMFDVTCHSDKLLIEYGLAPGLTHVFKFYGVLVDIGSGNLTQVTIEVDGFLKSIDQGQVRPGNKTTAKLNIACNYLKHTIGGTIVLEIDALNMVFNSNGTDIDATARQMLGLS